MVPPESSLITIVAPSLGATKVALPAFVASAAPATYEPVSNLV